MSKKTLTEIIARRQQGVMDKINIKTYYSETLESDITIVKKPLKKYMQVLESKDDDSTGIDFFNAMLFEFCPIFSEDTKAAMEVYGIDDPMELPCAILEDQMNEMADICDIINSFYGLDKLDKTVKN